MKILVICNNNFICNNFKYLTKSFNFEILEIKSNTELSESILSKVDQVFFPCIPENNLSQDKFWEKNLLLINSLSILIGKLKKEIYITFLLPKNINLSVKEILLNQIRLIITQNKNSVKVFFTPEAFGKWADESSVIFKIFSRITKKENFIKRNSTKIKLIYIDTLIEQITAYMLSNNQNTILKRIIPEYITSEQEIFDSIQAFKFSRINHTIDNLGTGLKRALYATYISHIEKENFVYQIPSYVDNRGIFAEFLKNYNFGQISFFTIAPKKTRGGHFHNTKTEKFLVLKGKVKFLFKNILNKEKKCFEIEGAPPFSVIETIPGWSHEIKNIGLEDVIVLLWANEVFDIKKPDTYGKNYYE